MLETLVDLAWLGLVAVIVLLVLGSVAFFLYDTLATYLKGQI